MGEILSKQLIFPVTWSFRWSAGSFADSRVSYCPGQLDQGGLLGDRRGHTINDSLVFSADFISELALS